MGLSEIDRVRLERDLYKGLLELGAKDDLRPLLEEALALVVELTRARKGLIELSGGFSIARALSDADVAAARRALSSGIIAEALATGRTVSTASALDDPRFKVHKSVQAGRMEGVVCAPVGALGVLYLEGRAEPGPFPEEDRARAELFARHLAPLADRLLAREAPGAREDHTKELRGRLSVGAIAGTSRALAEVFRQVLVAAPVMVPVLVGGESGTGKTAIARALHESSPRARGPFVELNCAALPEALFESELFGAEKGAHSTATRRIEGKVEAARGGTLFLDEIGEIPLAVQGKLLTFLQSRRYYRLGGTEAVLADVRIVAATNRDLPELVAQKRFREDLYYRLDVLQVRVPPLRERPEDIGPIADAAVRELARSEGREVLLSRAARAALAESEWPGNVRQLENVLSRGWATALSQGATTIEPAHLFPDLPGDTTDGEPTYQEATRRFQARLLKDALEATGWNVSETARRLDLARSHLNELIRAHGLARAPKKP